MRTFTRLNQGFTIIELLVVIVIIGILATITIVSYSGVTSQANTASAQAAAATTIQKIELYYVETGIYPYSFADLTSDASKSYYIPASIDFSLSTTAPASPSTVKFVKCGTTPNSAQSDITSGNHNITGIRIYYWHYTNGNADSYRTAGIDTGGGVACP